MPFGKDHLFPTDLLEEIPTDEEGPTPELVNEPIQELVSEVLPYPVRYAFLIVEDNDDVRGYLQQLFEPSFAVFLANDGIEGWEKAYQIQPDLVVSDIMMPRSDGLELCRRIKKNPKIGHIPVVLLTARTSAIHELEGLETGADDYIAKPFNPQILLAKVTSMLQSRFKIREYYKRQILLEPTEVVIPDVDRLFLEKSMKIVEDNLTDPTFGVPELCQEML